MKTYLACIPVLLLAIALPAQTPETALRQGLRITQSCRIKPGEYRLDATLAETFADSVNTSKIRPVLTIAGQDITVDFQNASLRSTASPDRPDLFTGLAILIQGKNITLKNARIRGYKVALLAAGADNLHLENCDFSYNYRPRLYSIREREDFSDWLSYHHNEQDEWLRYGAGIYLKNCDSVLVKGCHITANQNALLMTGCTGGLVYNNTFNFNSGLGIGLYRSSHNRIMHNRLDWNVRGYSHGFYQRGQDSAALLCYEQSNNNVFAFNSCTHSGDGFFLWAGQHTMDTGAGGCNDNFVFGNDFSHAPTNGVEATFSRNRIQGNLIRECTYGIWGGYSYESVFMGNYISQCKTGLAIEHGQNDTIRQNFFEDDSTGIQLWARKMQPADWGYAQKRDTRSRDGVIDRNVFQRVRTPLKISASQNISVNGENLFSGFQTLLETADSNENLRFLRNDIYGSTNQVEAVWALPELASSRKINFSHPEEQPLNPYAPLEIPYRELREIDSLPDGMFAALPTDQLQGRQYIFVDEWGPYDFQRPESMLGDIARPPMSDASSYVIKIYGPPGQWKLTAKKGIVSADQTAGPVPAFLTLKGEPGAVDVWAQFEFTAEQAFVDEFGDSVAAGQPYKFDFQRLEKKINWTTQFYNYPADQDIRDSLVWDTLVAQQAPAAVKTTDDLYYAWWDSPAPGVQADHFATISATEFNIDPGRYRIELSSDDGARLYLDGKRLIDHWDVHEPATDEITVKLSGQHHSIRVEHFDRDGFATLGFRMEVVR